MNEFNEGGHLKVNNIYHGNCLELMPKIQDKSIDCIICDLPYGITACSWDIIIPFDKLWAQYERIKKIMELLCFLEVSLLQQI